MERHCNIIMYKSGDVSLKAREAFFLEFQGRNRRCGKNDKNAVFATRGKKLRVN